MSIPPETWPLPHQGGLFWFQSVVHDRCNLRSAARAIDAPTEQFFERLKKRHSLVKEAGWLQPGWERSRDKHFVVRMRHADGKLRLLDLRDPRGPGVAPGSVGSQAPGRRR